MNRDNSFEDIIISPAKGKGESAIPARGLLIINPTDYFSFSHTHLGKEWLRCFFFNSNLHISPDQGYFVAGPLVGAPMAVMGLEKLIALGAEEITVLSWCGSFDHSDAIGDLILVDQARVGEGTSQYYTSENECSASGRMTAEHEFLMNEEDLPFRKGKCWSTDAPFRESRVLLENLRDSFNVNCIDMEISALMNVAKFRNVELGGVFMVSDFPLAARWAPGFKSKVFKKRAKYLLKSFINKHVTGGAV